MALTVAAASAQAMGAALATDIGSGAIVEIRSGAKPATPETTIHTGPASYTRIVSGPSIRRIIHPGRTL